MGRTKKNNGHPKSNITPKPTLKPTIKPVAEPCPEPTIKQSVTPTPDPMTAPVAESASEPSIQLVAEDTGLAVNKLNNIKFVRFIEKTFRELISPLLITRHVQNELHLFNVNKLTPEQQMEERKNFQ